MPLIVALPRYLGGELQLGGLMQTAQAFSNVQWALSWLIDNFPRFADWRASVDRVVQLHTALHDLEDTIETRDGEHIEVTPGDADRLVLREVGLSRPDGEALVAEAEVEIQPGERVLIRGQSGSGKSTIMRAIAGVWPWGRGSVELPKGRIAFMPQKPYFPLGTLRAGHALSAEARGHRRRRAARRPCTRSGSIICAAGSTRRSAGTTSCRAASSSAWPSRAC